MIDFNCAYDKKVGVNELKPHPRNPNKHSQEQIDRLAKLIEYQGFRSPIVVSNQTGFVVVGHCRLAAAKHLGAAHVPVNFQDFEDDEQEFTHMTADNAIASWADLDLSLVNEVVPELGPDLDIDLLGIENFEIDVSDRFQDEEIEDSESQEKENRPALTIEFPTQIEKEKVKSEMVARGFIVKG